MSAASVFFVSARMDARSGANEGDVRGVVERRVECKESMDMAGESVSARRVVKSAEMVEGKTSREARSESALWNARGTTMERPTM